MDNNNIKKQVDDNIWADPELAELLFYSEENRENEIVEPRQAGIEEENFIDDESIQDPDESYRLYHKTLQAKLRIHLKHVSEEAKKRIREQVNLLLKDGHKKGRDGKQAYNYRFEQAINIINRWESLCNAGQIPLTETKTLRLYMMFLDAVNLINQKPQ